MCIKVPIGLKNRMPKKDTAAKNLLICDQASIAVLDKYLVDWGLHGKILHDLK